MSRYLGVPARVLLLTVALSIVPAFARADYVYTVTDTSVGVSTQFSFTEPTLASSGTITSGLTQISGATVTGFAWNQVGGFCFGVALDNFACAGIDFGALEITYLFSPGSFLAPGTYTSLDETTTVNIAQTQTGVPEPSSLLLLGSGILGLLGTVRRKLKA